MTFGSGEKSLIVNKTNGKAMAKLFGRDTADWIGKKITLVPTEVDFKGDLVDAIRIRTTPPARAVPRTAAVEEPPFNDEIGISGFQQGRPHWAALQPSAHREFINELAKNL